MAAVTSSWLMPFRTAPTPAWGATVAPLNFADFAQPATASSAMSPKTAILTRGSDDFIVVCRQLWHESIG